MKNLRLVGYRPFFKDGRHSVMLMVSDGKKQQICWIDGQYSLEQLKTIKFQLFETKIQAYFPI